MQDNALYIARFIYGEFGGYAKTGWKTQLITTDHKSDQKEIFWLPHLRYVGRSGLVEG
jgi:hypothetical protein